MWVSVCLVHAVQKRVYWNMRMNKEKVLQTMQLLDTKVLASLRVLAADSHPYIVSLRSMQFTMGMILPFLPLTDTALVFTWQSDQIVFGFFIPSCSPNLWASILPAPDGLSHGGHRVPRFLTRTPVTFGEIGHVGSYTKNRDGSNHITSRLLQMNLSQSLWSFLNVMPCCSHRELWDLLLTARPFNWTLVVSIQY